MPALSFLVCGILANINIYVFTSGGRKHLANNSAVKAVWAKLEELALSMELELVDISLSKEAGEYFLRIAIDKTGGISLDDCEKFHKQAIAFVEDIDYDYLECSSPGLDYAFKKQRDYERNMGKDIEVRLFAPKNGVKQFVGKLVSCDENGFTVLTKKLKPKDSENEITFTYKETALARLYVDFSGVLQ